MTDTNLFKALDEEWETLKNMIMGEKIPYPKDEIERAYNNGLMRAVIMIRRRHIECFGCAPLPDWLKEKETKEGSE